MHRRISLIYDSAAGLEQKDEAHPRVLKNAAAFHSGLLALFKYVVSIGICYFTTEKSHIYRSKNTFFYSIILFEEKKKVGMRASRTSR